MSGSPITDEQKRLVIEAVGKGAHPQVACTAARLSQSYYRVLRYRARANEPEAVAFLADIEAAQAQAEIDDVAAAHRATQPIEEAEIHCTGCDQAIRVDADTVAALAMRVFDLSKAKSLAADIALKKLERRHPKRWSQKVVHTIAEEHDGLLNVVQRVAERLSRPDFFELVLEEYVSAGDGESEAPGSPSGQAEGGVH